MRKETDAVKEKSGHQDNTADNKAHIHSEHSHSEGTPHKHKHSPEEYTQLLRRTSIIIGHMGSIKKMIEDERDCAEILIQISAVQSSLNSLGKLILKNHINECLIEAVDTEDQETFNSELSSLNDAIDKFIR